MKNLLLFLLLGLSLGIDKFYANYLPYDFFGAIPLVLFPALIYVLINIKKIVWNDPIKKQLAFLTLYGLILAVSRYYYIYDRHELLIAPIFRQAVSFIFGSTLFIFFQLLFKKHDFNLVGKGICYSSIPFLFIGVSQHFNGNLVGFFPRIVSLFSEPSYYGDYLVLLILPFLVQELIKFRLLNLIEKYILGLITILWLMNFVAIQSGTAILKLGTLIVFLIAIFPLALRQRTLIFLSFTGFTLLFIFFFEGYAADSFHYGIRILSSPDLFLKNHTFYDRFFPIYVVFKNFLSLNGITGLGFGGDYYEFYNLYPKVTHEVMLLSKPTLSFFNSFTSKVVLYFGILGVLWFLKLFLFCLKTKSSILKVAILCTLISTFWGLSNFSLPYLWFWLALADKEINENA
jgi:hypothetical protein